MTEPESYRCPDCPYHCGDPMDLLKHSVQKHRGAAAGLPELSPLNSEAVVEIVEQMRTGLPASARLREAEAALAAATQELALTGAELDQAAQDREELRRGLALARDELAAVRSELEFVRHDLEHVAAERDAAIRQRNQLDVRLATCETCDLPIDRHKALCPDIVGPILDRVTRERDEARAEADGLRLQLAAARDDRDFVVRERDEQYRVLRAEVDQRAQALLLAEAEIAKVRGFWRQCSAHRDELLAELARLRTASHPTSHQLRTKESR